MTTIKVHPFLDADIRLTKGGGTATIVSADFRGRTYRAKIKPDGFIRGWKTWDFVPYQAQPTPVDIPRKMAVAMLIAAKMKRVI